MKCLLCDLKNNDDVELKNHYLHFHLIDKNNHFFKELFSTDTANKYSNRCEECRMLLDTCRKKKNHCFLKHYVQSGGSNNFPWNILKRSIITYYSINFSLHKNYYDFYNAEKTVNDFSFSVEKKFAVSGKVALQGPMELINYQPAETDTKVKLEGKRTWLTDVYTCAFFNGYVQQELKKNYENGNYKRYDR